MKEMKPYEHKVQYYETDQMGIVHHSNYIRWFEEARTFILENMGFGYKEMEQSGIISPVLSITADYKTMTHFSDIVVVKAKVTTYNGIKLLLSYEVTDKETNEVRCTGESKHCFLNEEGKPISLKKSFPEIHKAFEKLLEISKE